MAPLHSSQVYEGVSTRSWNHPKVKEPETSFWYVVHKKSLHTCGLCAKLHIYPTICWLSTDQNYTIRSKSAILRLIKIDNFCESTLNDILCLAVTGMFMVRFCSWIVFSLKLICFLDQHFVGLTSIKCTQNTFPGGAQKCWCFIVWSPFLETDFSFEFQNHTPMWQCWSVDSP